MVILFISFYYPPYSSIGALRTGKTVQYLRLMGHEVDVITAANQPLEPVLEVNNDKGETYYTKWVNINLIAELLSGGRKKIAAEGFAVGKKNNNLIGRLGNFYKNCLNIPDGQIGWYPFAVNKGASMLKRKKYDLIYASCWPVTSLLIASRLSKKFGVPWVAEMRDLWTLSPYLNQPKWRRLIEKKMESKTLSSASGFVTVSHPLARDLSSIVTCPVEIIHNGFDPCDYPEEDLSISKDDKIRIVHMGTIYAGKRDPTILFEALRSLGEEKKNFIVQFYGRYTGFLQSLIEDYDLAECVSIFSSVAYETSLKYQLEADIALLLLWDNPKEEGTFTGKFFEYMGAEQPILTLGPQKNVAAEMVLQRKMGWVLSDTSEAVELLRSLINDKEKVLKDRSYSRNSFKEYSRKAQTAKLSLFLQSIIQRQLQQQNFDNKTNRLN